MLQLDDASFHEWDLSTGAETRAWKAPSESNPFGPAFLSPDEKFCLMPKSGRIRDMATGTEMHLEVRMWNTDNATFSPDGRRFAIASYLGFVRIWDTSDWKELANVRGCLIGAHSVAFSPDSERVATGSGGKEAVKLWDARGRQELLTLEGVEGSFLRTTFSPDGNTLGSMNAQGMLHLWSAPSWEENTAAEASGKNSADRRQ